MSAPKFRSTNGYWQRISWPLRRRVCLLTSSTARLVSPIRPRGSCSIASAKRCANNEPEPFGSGGGGVEVDETFIGHDKSKKPEGEKKGRGYDHKYKILTLVDRESKQARSIVVDDLKQSTLLPILRENIASEAAIYTDEAAQYRNLKREFASHDFVSHIKAEYGRGEVHTNTAEGYFSIFKRGMKGVYQHCGRQHLHRYAAEFEFRYNNRVANGVDDSMRAAKILKGAEGKRMMYV